jgi:hypothetical protein
MRRPPSFKFRWGPTDALIVLRSAAPEALSRLMRAAHEVDRELDTALICLGVLPPLDLSVIRSWLTLDDVGIRASTNADGHRVIDVMVDRRPAAWIHPDGRVVVAHESRTFASA